MSDRRRSELLTPAGEIWLDISRLLYNVLRGKITGIDRVEIAYAEHLLGAVPDQTRFVAYDYWSGSFRMLNRGRAVRLIQAITPAWNAGTMRTIRSLAGRAFLGSLSTSPVVPAYAGGDRPVYINVSSHPLHLVERIGKMTERTGALFVPLVHDLIPIAFPEYVPPQWVAYHQARIRTIADYADGVISNSAVTTAALREYVPALPIETVPLGVGALFSQARDRFPPGQPGARPYFVVIGTIEPRKNHLLLLNVWRRLVKDLGDSAPELMIIGRRGWENEQVLDMLERSRDIKDHVQECGMISDGAMTDLLAGARALLLPSFFEGYSLPVVEAITMGVPVICSDIEVHREVGKTVPDFIDPLDGAGWLRAIKDYARPDSAARAAQLQRIQGWRSPCWAGHVAAMLHFIAGLSPRRAVAAPGWPRRAIGDLVKIPV
jgi:glycosyltransferase involved in cell wall biosynthesis